MIIRDDIPLGYTYDSVGRELTYKAVNGGWSERRYDVDGHEVYFADSTGYVLKRWYDDVGRIIAYDETTVGWCEYFYDLGVNVYEGDMGKICVSWI